MTKPKRNDIIDTHAALLYEDLLESVRKPNGRLWFDMCRERMENACYETSRELVEAATLAEDAMERTIKTLERTKHISQASELRKIGTLLRGATGNANYEKFRKREGK